MPMTDSPEIGSGKPEPIYDAGISFQMRRKQTQQNISKTMNSPHGVHLFTVYAYNSGYRSLKKTE